MFVAILVSLQNFSVNIEKNFYKKVETTKIYLTYVHNRNILVLKLFCLSVSLHQKVPLHMAAEEGHKDIVECLVDKGADINIKNNDGVKYITFCYMQLITTPDFISFQASPTPRHFRTTLEVSCQPLKVLAQIFCYS